MALTLAPENDNIVTLERVVDYISGPVTDMEGTITIYKQTVQNTIPTAADVLAGCDALPITFATTWDDKPVYYVIVPASVQIADGAKYRAVFQSTNYGVRIELELTGKRLVLK